ncbi:MAG: SDR family oxidoreductase [Myxococcota bacterium]|nr:SDR family oxidoreductase [Myxococcota bacterium]
MNPTRRCAPELLKQDLSGKIYIITGANSGVGLGTARQLVEQGAHVVLACRRVSAGEEAAQTLATLSGTTEVIALDLGSLSSVRAFAEAFLERHSRLDALVNNAGLMNTPQGKTQDGFETQFGVNHLGHFLLTELLLEVLKSSAPSRVICVASAYHVEAQGKPGRIVLDDLNFERRPYDGWEAYAQAKLANVLHAQELARRLEGSGVSAFSVHPGWVRTNLISSTMPSWLQNVVMRPIGALIDLISVEDGAQTTLHCLLDPQVPETSGAFYAQTGSFPDKQDRKGGWPMTSPNPQVRDLALAEALYVRSRDLVGLT